MKSRPKDRISDVKINEPDKAGDFDPEIAVIHGEAKLAKPSLETHFSVAEKTGKPETKITVDEEERDLPPLATYYAAKNASRPDTKIEVGGKEQSMPPLATYFVGSEYAEQKKGRDDDCSTHVAGVFCSCNKVSICSCAGYSSGGSSGGGGGCRCAPVH